MAMIQRHAKSKSSIMLSRTIETPRWAKSQLRNMWQRLEQVIFAAFMASLVTLLVLLYADVPIIGY
jgi:hypothetical protein